ncbi:MAG: RNA polymerase sigma factor [Acidobacteria bacterium]|nr:RNA polymerase sigma factor [Acidobacteriota bacterium]
MERHHAESYGWAMACCRRDSAEAEAVLHAAYVKVLEGKARFDGLASFKTWLFSVIRRTGADEWRRRVLRKLRLAKHLESLPRVAECERPDDAVYRSEVQSMFRAALAALPRRQQEVLQLVFYHDLSLVEAARAMDISVGSARTHYDRGKRHLRSLIEKSKVLDESPVG